MFGVLNEIVKLLFPPKCIFCRRILGAGVPIEICNDCHKEVPFLDGPVIRTENPSRGECDSIVGVCKYTGIIKDSLIRYKFSDKPGYYRAFAAILHDRIKKMTDYCRFDIIVSVPLHKHRERSRGYNQSYLIAKELGRKLKLPVNQKLLCRIRDTGSQSLLGKKERSVNVTGAFKVTDASMLEGKTVLLVDDILTTGSTINECSRILKESGAVKVIGAVIAAGRRI